jgi:hypothetical protein
VRGARLGLGRTCNPWGKFYQNKTNRRTERRVHVMMLLACEHFWENSKTKQRANKTNGRKK